MEPKHGCARPEVYEDGTWARAGAVPVNGANTWAATAEDTLGRTDVASVTVNLLASQSFVYDGNGNLLTSNNWVLDLRR